MVPSLEERNVPSSNPGASPPSALQVDRRVQWLGRGWGAPGLGFAGGWRLGTAQEARGSETRSVRGGKRQPPSRNPLSDFSGKEVPLREVWGSGASPAGGRQRCTCAGTPRGNSCG